MHIVTVNDYLAKRDSEWMGKIYNFLGLSVGLIIHDLNSDRTQAGLRTPTSPTAPTTNLDFDYLRDNMAIYKENQVQRGHFFTPLWTRWTPS